MKNYINQGDFLESGGQPTFRTFTFALKQWMREKIPWKTYITTWFILLCVLMIRRITIMNKSDIENYYVERAKNPLDFALMYKSIKSAPVDKEDDSVQFIIKEMKATAAEYNYRCLAAIHIGYPLRILLVDDDENGENILINPTLVAGEGGHKLSRAKEFSAFGGPPVIKTRQMPVTVRDDEGYHIFNSRESVHCIFHVIEQFVI